MKSSLDLDANEEQNDPLPSTLTNRRGQRDQQSPSHVYSLRDTKSVLAIPLVFLLIVMQAMYQLIGQLIVSPAKTMREFFVVNREVDEILREIPEEQAKQKIQLERAHQEQIDQRHRLEDLQRRIEAIERRRAAREKET